MSVPEYFLADTGNVFWVLRHIETTKSPGPNNSVKTSKYFHIQTCTCYSWYIMLQRYKEIKAWPRSTRPYLL